MRTTLTPVLTSVLTLAVLLSVSGLSLKGQVVTRQYDNGRTGAAVNERILTPANVNASSFGKVFSFPVDGDVYAQPLYLPRVEVPGKGTHDVLYVATEHDTVYAFDAAGQPREPLWQVSFLDARAGVEPLSERDVRCPFIAPEVGITPTPVIDRQTGTLYVLARTKESPSMLSSSRYVQKLHALAITTGAEKFGGPIEITADGFDPIKELPRSALLLANGQLYLTWGSSCDVGPYHGWVMAYDAATLKQTAVLNTSPAEGQSGIWQADNGPAVDASGHVYVITGNGKFTVDAGGKDYGDSALKLKLAGNQLQVVSYFTPANQSMLNDTDKDFGAGGPLVIPDDQPAAGGRHLLIGAGKDGVVYALDRDHLGPTSLQGLKQEGGMYSTPAYWNGHLFVLATNDALKDYTLSEGRLSSKPVASSAKIFGNPGATPVVSANGTRDGIVWFLETKAFRDYQTQKPTVLHAFDAANVAHEIYGSDQNPGRDSAGPTIRFTVPTVANGRVYVPARREVTVYGLLGVI